MKYLSAISILLLCSVAATCQTSHSATVSWGASTTTGVTYQVLRAPIAAGPFTALKSGLSVLSFVDANLPANTQECYEVIVQSANNQDSDPTIPVCGSTLKDKAAPAGAVVVVFQ